MSSGLDFDGAYGETRKKLALIGYAHLAAGAVYLLCAVLALFATTQAGLLFEDERALFVNRTVGYALTLVLVVLGAGSLSGGLGLLRSRMWARTVLVVMGVLNLTNVPIGTLLGGYTLWVLLRDEAARALARGGPLPPDVRAP